MRPHCPRCQAPRPIKSGIVQNRQRYKCKECHYHFTVEKLGKRIPEYYVTKALQLYLEGLSFREIERLLGISHVTVMNWVKIHRIHRPERTESHPTFKMLTHAELLQIMGSKQPLKGGGMLISEMNGKYMIIDWQRFRNG